jgi:hypothetical protein
MNPLVNEEQTPQSPVDGGRLDGEEWDRGPVPSRFRRRRGVVALAVLAVVVLAVVGVAWYGVARERAAESDIGGDVKAPPCAEPGSREPVEPEVGPAFSFRTPECFRPEGPVEPAANGRDGTRVLLVPVDITLTPGERPMGQIRVSAADVGIDAAAESEEEVTEQLRRGLGITDGADVTMARRTVDGARGWGFHVDSPHRTFVAWSFLKGTMQVNLICQWFGDDLAPRMLAGCNQVVDTLTIA